MGSSFTDFPRVTGKPVSEPVAFVRMGRSSPKKLTWKKRSYAKPTRSLSYRKTASSSRRVMTNSGMKSSVGSAPYQHKFIRLGEVTDLVSINSGGFIIQPTPVVTSPGVFFGVPTADPSGVANTYQVGGSCFWTLNDVPSVTDFTALFDQYRIDQVDIEISQVQNAASAGNPASQMATIYYCPDYDDADIPASASVLLQKQRCKKWTFRGDGKPLRISVQPRVSMPVYRDGVTNAYAPASQSTFIDAKNVDVQYYGMKFWIENMYGSAALLTGETHFKWNVKYHLSFKDPI